MGRGAFRIPFCSIKDRFVYLFIYFWGERGDVHLEYSPSLTVGRTSSMATNCLSKVWKISPAIPDLHKEATESFCIPQSCTFSKAVRYRYTF